MAGKATKCAQIQERMLDAASGSLSGSFRAAFEAHLSGCAACAEEVRHVETLARAIDRSLSGSLSVEPSPQLMGNIQRQISTQSHRVTWLRQWSAWLTAAGVCAAFAISVLAVRSVREFNRPTRDHAAASINAPATPEPAVHPRVNAGMEAGAAAQSREQALAVARHASLRAVHRKAVEPEIIVAPGQMQAILRLAAETQSGQVDGAKLLFVDPKKAAKPLAIEPLVIAPLKIATLDVEKPSASGDGENVDKGSVPGHEN